MPDVRTKVLAGQSVPGQGWPTTKPEDSNRRSIYVHIKRSLRLPILSMFDQADTDTTCPARYVTTVPTQALGLFNGEFTHEIAEGFVKRLKKEEPTDTKARVARAIRLTSGRTPGAAELERDLKFLDDLTTREKLTHDQAWVEYAVLLLNTNEFIYLD